MSGLDLGDGVGQLALHTRSTLKREMATQMFLIGDSASGFWVKLCRKDVYDDMIS